MKEEWRTVVIDGKEHPWYSISNFGNIRSHLQIKGLPGGGSSVFCNLSYYKEKKPSKMKNTDGSISGMRVKLRFPMDFFEDYQYYKDQKCKISTNVDKKCSVHQLVMEAFRPMDDYPPDRLKDCWNDIPEDAKTWICLLYTSPSPRDVEESRMPSSA